MLTVGDLMTPNPGFVKADTPLREVIDKMKVDCCRQLPVVDDSGISMDEVILSRSSSKSAGPRTFAPVRATALAVRFSNSRILPGQA